MASALKQAKRIIPLFDRVLIQRIKAPERTASGLFIPEKAQETLNEGLVIAVGPGAPATKDASAVRPMSIKEGERVLLPPYGGNQVKLGDQEYFLFKEEEILGKLE
ncbi:10 kDa heat shock protein [Geranomyces variabilis]|uniref:10 kDa heat shock protein n=1 Tax=Geranomyces variabilis TaxID=109894 RepID=A0AAD5TG34_9FUNG|nr:chaperonin 10-like protein [Geranomyces variabilis]KAJ3134919.1 10 kDa heat shock protein [Geranomyces variabilis]KAJ3145047.1 10 kDa heat shock protein [Geranomyces variabilis]KAJ3174839.1 10 kDa heat shock protein [Geranomyces variabilis]